MRATTSPIDAVLFDFTGVITNSPFVGLARLEDELGVAVGSITRLVMGDYDQDTDHPWHRLERGEIPAAEYYQAVVRLAQDLGAEVDYGAVFRRLGDLNVRPQVVERITAIRHRGWKTALVTNNVREFGDAWRALIPVEDMFDVVADSCLLGVRKPDPVIFRRTLELLGGVEPDRAVFLDDLESNVAAARRVGLHGIVFGDPDEALADLDRLLSGSSTERELQWN